MQRLWRYAVFSESAADGRTLEDDLVIRVVAALLLLMLAAPAAQAASFDCGKASTSFERAICASPDLSMQDEVMAQAYATALGGLSKAAADEIKSVQHDWLGYAERICSDDAKPIEGTYTDEQAQCLGASFAARIKDLEASRMQGGYRFYPFDLYLVEQDTDADSNAYNKVADKHFGTIHIDRDSELATAFDAVADEVRGDYPEFFTKDGADIATGATTEDMDITVTVKSVTASRISLEVNDYWYGHGAAHGNYGVTYRHFLTAEQRALVESDVFAGDDWQKVLGKLVLDRLQATIDGGVWDDAVADIPKWAADPKRWDFSDGGLVVQFQPYEVTAYAAGAPTVTIPWDDLRSVLAEGAEQLTY